MNAEFIQLIRNVNVAANGGTATIELESGTPYRHFIVWAKVSQLGVIDIDAQPIYAGQNDGSAVNITSTDITKVFQCPVDEIRPATRGLIKHADDTGPAFSAKPGVLLTNNNLTIDANVNIYMIAAASPGGA
jgi:hypothetical protein